MAGKTYKTRGIVLRKTKLAEKDLIVTILDETGSLVRAVAKGARKPGGSYAARLELFSIVDLMLAQGKNLDVITGATFTDEATRSPLGVEQAACASALAELLATIAQEDLPHERLYAMSKAAFEGRASVRVLPRASPAETASTWHMRRAPFPLALQRAASLAITARGHPTPYPSMHQPSSGARLSCALASKRFLHTSRPSPPYSTRFTSFTNGLGSMPTRT